MNLNPYRTITALRALVKGLRSDLRWARRERDYAVRSLEHVSAERNALRAELEARNTRTQTAF